MNTLALRISRQNEPPDNKITAQMMMYTIQKSR